MSGPGASGHAPGYVVHSAAGAARAGALAVGYPVAAGVVLGLVSGRWWVVGVLAAVSVLFSLSSLSAAWTPLRVDAAGISMSFPQARRPGRSPVRGVERRFVAWAWVHRVEVAPGTGVVRVVVRSDAPLPPWERGRVIDPADPESGPRLEREVPGLDAAALRLAVLTVSPSTPFSR